jgi:FkbM family methyltransferase
VIDPGRPVVLYGAGQLGLLALAFCRHIGINVRYVLDRNAAPGQLLNGQVPVLLPAQIEADQDCPVLITVATSPYSPIARDLGGWRWTNVLPFYDYAQHFASAHPLNNGWFAGALCPQDRTEIRAVLDRLADNHSRNAYLQFLAWRVFREDWVFPDAPVRAEDKYSIPQVAAVLSDKEDLVDVGAYDGRFLFHLLEVTHGRFSSALLFEPDQANLDLLQPALARLDPLQRQKVEVSSQAVSDASGLAGFSQGFDMASRLSAEGNSTVTSVRIDELGLRPSYLKIHVEGAELKVLRGAAGTLSNCRPIIAATVYHNRDGLWETASFLMNLLEGYDFLFRLHTWCGTGAVLYAIPRERPKRSRAPGTQRITAWKSRE